MSSIKKYIGGETKEWIKFAETNVDPKELSSARNISVEFGQHSSVNDILKDHDDAIQSLKRNVSWLALHGGGGSGTGGGSSTARKASCQILVNDGSGPVSISKGQSLFVTLQNFKGSDTSVPWTIICTIDGETVFQTNKAQGILEKIQIETEWDYISRFFEGEASKKNHSLRVSATYKDENIEGGSGIETSIYIPNVEFGVNGLTDKIDVRTAVQSILWINTALKGWFRLCVRSFNGKTLVLENPFPPTEKTNDNYHEQNIADFREAFKNEQGQYQLGIFSVEMQLQYRKDSSLTWQNVAQIQKNMIIYNGEDVEVILNVDGISMDESSPTEIYDNSKDIYFKFMAFRAESTIFKYDVVLKDQDGQHQDIIIRKNYEGQFETYITVNQPNVEALIESHSYVVEIKLKNPSYEEYVWCTRNGYITCVKGEYSFINYSRYGERSRLFSIDTFNNIINTTPFKGDITLSCYNSSDTVIENSISTNVSIYYQNSRSGIIEDESRRRSIRLYDTYMDIENKFTSRRKSGEQIITDSTNIQSNSKFTICICYKCYNYNNSNHVIFSLCDDGILSKGISIKNDGVYVKDSKVLPVYGTRINTIHIVYDNSSSDKTYKWGENSFYKIYVNGVITCVEETCPFIVDENNKILFNNLKIYLNGSTSDGERIQQCNCDIYDLEIFGYSMNEMDILGSYINNKVRTTYTNSKPDFSIVQKEINKNCCSYDQDTRTISSSIYFTSENENKFNFNDTFFDHDITTDKYSVPYATDPQEIQAWTSKLSSIQLPIVYIDIIGGESQGDWTWTNFIKTGTEALQSQVVTEFSYWDTTTGKMPIRSNTVKMKLQGTSTREDYIKNVQIDFEKRDDEGKIVQDMLFVKKDWIPENTYVLKADIVDSSHANNASIGRFINENFKHGNDFGFDFDERNIALTNIGKTTETLKDTQGWIIEPELKHTVEGFQVLLFIRFFGENTFRCMGIYSFNIGRNAARNLGFNHVTGIKSHSGQTEMNKVSPCILSSVIVYENTQQEDVYWVENSNSQNFSHISSWNTTTHKISADMENNPSYDCRFWHQVQGDGDLKLNQLFEVKYFNGQSEPTPTGIQTFKNFVKQISLLPVEGLVKSDSISRTEPQVTGEYYTWKYDNENKWQRLDSLHSLKATQLVAGDIDSFDTNQLIMYFSIASLFGLIDNLDKNVSFRIFGPSKIIAEFYDMDTALGLDNSGKDDVTPTVCLKILTNYRNNLEQDYPYETMNNSEGYNIFPSRYQKFMPETYTNKIWLSLDTESMRTINKVFDYSMYSNQWFRLRQYLDIKAKENNYDSFVDYFIEKYFENQLDCGTFMYNYDYTMKYLNDYNQTGQKQSQNTIVKLHGRRVDEAREWLRQHIDFLDSYYFWRSNYTYIRGSNQVPTGLNTVINKSVKIRTLSNNKQIPIETQYPVLVHTSSTADGNEVGDTVMIENHQKNIKIPGGGTGKPMKINCTPILKNINFIDLGISQFRATDGSKITGIESIVIDGLNIERDGFNMDDFYDSSDLEPNVLKLISMNSTKFSNEFSLNLNRRQFLNVTYVDILSASNVTKFFLYNNTDDPSDTTTQNMRYLNVNYSGIENLLIKNQKSLILPQVNGCSKLASVKYYDCNLDNVEGNRQELSNYSSISFYEQDNIEKIEVENVEQINNVNSSKCQSLKNVKLCNVSALGTVLLTKNNNLSSVIIQDCPKLYNITVTECKNLKEICILNAPKLQTINFNYDTSLTAIRISRNSVSSVTSINIRNCDISGFNYYNESFKLYDDIQVDPLGNKVLDFKPFTSLPSNGIIMKKDQSGDYTEDKCCNFQSIRVPNKKGVSYNILDDGYYRLTNLSNVYGHVTVGSATFHASGLPQNGMFLKYGEDYLGYPKFLSSEILRGGRIDIGTLLKQNTILDLFEKNTTLSSMLSSNSLKDIEGYIQDNFISVGNIVEFDDSEWATNYTVTSLSRTAMGSYLNELMWQYLIYRYSIYIRTSQTSGSNIGMYYFATYAPTGWSTYTPIEIPVNSFRYIGNTVNELNRIIYTVPVVNNIKAKYHIKHDMMKFFPQLTSYNAFSDNDNLEYNALSSCHSIQLLGTTSTGDHLEKTTTIVNDVNNSFFDNVGQLRTISYFNPYNLNLSGYELPNTLTSITDSFNGNSNIEIIDIKKLIGNCSHFKTFTNSLTSSTFLLKPKTFENLSDLVTLRFSEKNKKYIVENDISVENLTKYYSTDYNDYIVKEDYRYEESDNREYTQEMFDEFITDIFKHCHKLGGTSYIFANSKIPYITIYNQELYPNVTSSLFRNNPDLTDVRFMMWNANFGYCLSSGLFYNQKNLTTVEGAFQNDPSIGFGIESGIPYRFFYHGSYKNRIDLSGTDRFEQGTLYSFDTFKMKLESTFVPSDTKVGSTSIDAADLSVIMFQSGLSNIQAFNSVSSEYLGGNEYVYIPNDLSSYLSCCPLATVISNEQELRTEISVTTDGIPLYRTLSTLFSQLSVTDGGIPQRWRKTLCGLSCVSIQVEVPNAKITNINRCFKGNINIKPYTGKIVSELNLNYNPFVMNFDPNKNQFTFNLNRNRYLYDDQWSNNGAIWKKNAEGDWEVDISNYNPNNYNITTTDLSVVSCDYQTKYSYETITEPKETIEIYGGIMIPGKYSVQGSTQLWFDYWISPEQIQCFNYAFPPDTFRYCSENTTELIEVFADCDYLLKGISQYGCHPKNYNIGAKGRIPSNILDPVKNVRDVTGLFKNLYHITGYSTPDSTGKIRTYVVPHRLFEKSSNITNFTNMFSGILLNYDSDICRAFTNIESGSKQKMINIYGIFSKCVWFRVNSVEDFLYTKYLSNIDNAFGTRNSDDSKVKDGGVMSECNPNSMFNNFKSTKYIQTSDGKIAGTYYSKDPSFVADQDVARGTANNSGRITPS